MLLFRKKLMCILISMALPVASCNDAKVPDPAPITGSEQTEIYLPLLRGKSIALVANNTSRIGNTHLVDSLLSNGVNVIRIFSPEHGFRGEAGAGEAIDNAVDVKTGIPVISLYGSGKKPTAKDLQGIDLVVYDIQDVGVRFYTYISTLHYVMEACSENNIPVMVFDRPDPLGFYIDGPVLDTAYSSFVGMHPIPVVYGMTVGELARMINGEGWMAKGLHADLNVIPCVNYNHNTVYHLPVDPSPNLNSMEAIYLYPSLCFFEGTIMSLGRGTDFPFRAIGHPEYPVKTFSFTPKASSVNRKPLFLNEVCYGIDLRSMSAYQLQSVKQINLQWLIDVYYTMGKGRDFFINYIDKLAGSGDLREQIIQGMLAEEIRQSWQADLDKFRALRKKYLLYDDFK